MRGERFLQACQPRFDRGVTHAQRRLHLANAAFGEDEDAEEMQIVFPQGRELIGGEAPGEREIARLAVELGGDERALAGGATDVEGYGHGDNVMGIYQM